MVQIPIPLGGATGPSGPIGPEGLPGGATGVIAPVGLVGLPGPTGVLGVTGVQGVTGPAAPGPTGPEGETGPIGITGVVGDVGVTGDIGVTGDTGPDGDAGGIGLTGPQGNTGIIGLTGDTGPNGAVGGTGPTGVAGADFPATINISRAKPTSGGSQTIPGGVLESVLVSFTRVLYDSGVTFLAGTTIKILTAGLYIFTTNIEWGAVGGFDFAFDTTSRVRIIKNSVPLDAKIAINGGNDSFVTGASAGAGFDHRTSVSVMDLAAVDDEYEVWVFHNSTAGPPFNASVDRDSHFSCVMVGT